MQLDLKLLTEDDRTNLLNGAVVPRPIAWVSTLDRDGNLMLASFSYFTAVCSDPMTLLFCVSNRDQPAGKVTVRNITALGEFVINFPNNATAAALNLTTAAPPTDQSSFEWAGVNATPSQTIRVPRVSEAPIAFECRLQQIMQIGYGPSGTAVIFAEVKSIYVRDDLYQDGRILIEAYQPIGRLEGNGYTRVTDRFEMTPVPTPE
jgi:flavin reductase (DIM6/NTAB) family NADH-FMN oxidoreductase RutF